MPLRAHVEALIRHLMPPIDLAARAIATEQNQLPRRIDDALQREWSLIEEQIDAGFAAIGSPFVAVRVAEARRALDEVATSTVRALDAAMSSLHTAIEAAYAGLHEDLVTGPVTVHAFYVKFLLPIWFDVQSIGYAQGAQPSKSWRYA